MGFMAAAMPYLAQAGMAAAATGGQMAAQKGAEAIFGGNAENANQAPMAPGGPQQGGAAMQILAGLQQQMQAEEQRRQQALMALLTQSMGPMQAPQQPIQMES